jgi:hypothetical protein
MSNIEFKRMWSESTVTTSQTSPPEYASRGWVKPCRITVRTVHVQTENQIPTKPSQIYYHYSHLAWQIYFKIYVRRTISLEEMNILITLIFFYCFICNNLHNIYYKPF